MTFQACAWESELTQALRSGHWPEACGPELHAHVAACAACNDLVLVTETLQRAKNASPLPNRNGSPSLLWWRAELRRRHQVAERISEPITIAQVFAWVVSLVVAVAFLASQYRYGLRWGTWWPQLAGTHASWHWSLASFSPQWNFSWLIPATGIFVLLSGIALYLALERE